MSSRKELLLKNYGPAGSLYPAPKGGRDGCSGGSGGVEATASVSVFESVEDVGGDGDGGDGDPLRLAMIHMHMSVKDGLPCTLKLRLEPRLEPRRDSNAFDSNNSCITSESNGGRAPPVSLSSLSSPPLSSLSVGSADSVPYNFIHIGSAGCAYNRVNLIKYGITHMLCLCQSTKFIFEEKGASDTTFPNIAFIKVKLADKPDEDLSRILETCTAFIDSCRHYDKGKILIHCFQGKSRSVAVCCSYLMSRFHLSLDEAMLVIKDARPIADPNIGFIRQLRDFEKNLLSSR